MRVSAVRGLLALATLLNAGIGVCAMADPVTTLGIVGVAPVDAGGLVELRAMYGGFAFGFTGFFAWCLADRSRARVGLMAASLTLCGLGFGRLGAWLVHQPEGWLHPALVVVELFGAGAGLIALALDPEG